MTKSDYSCQFLSFSDNNVKGSIGDNSFIFQRIVSQGDRRLVHMKDDMRAKFQLIWARNGETVWFHFFLR